MATTSEYYERALSLIDEFADLHFVSDLIDEMAISAQTFYRHFPAGSDKCDDIKKGLDRNRRVSKRKARRNWLKEKSPPALQIAGYKLIATKEEMEILNNTPSQAKDEKPTIKIENYIPLPKDGSNNGD